ncbi:GldG family protein [Thiopseudomonas acetoxidans]|uniref:Gldg family protein n=1 Tax=Thiopseudomonas acetoxidans TaxID=3041622 RepID=A0ABT7SP01_9GAMM|nr:Gldg family protein [Thiopseudomonas sp. CY1220]MDM7857923.1 Gldg family protein [Thiopseudomonas sp. CY1220]
MKRMFYSSLGLVVVALTFFVFNALSSLLFKGVQLDLTEQKLYTLTEGTQQLLAGLDEPIELYFFYSNQAARDMPQVRHYAQRVHELLATYTRLADGKLKLHVIEPEPFSAQEDQAAQMGLQAIPLAQGESLYLGLAGKNSQGDVQSIAFFALEQEELLEYELSRMLHALSQTSLPVIGVMSGLQLNGGFDMLSGQAQPAWMVMEEVRQQFQIESIALTADEIPESVSVLWLVHPQNLSPPTLYAIDQFVMRGGKLLVFVDPYSEFDTGMSMAADELQARASNLQTLFEAWGLRLRDDVVVGDSLYAMTVGVGSEQRAVRHLGWLNLPKQALSAEDVVTAPLQNITLATAGVLEPLEGATTLFTPLLQTSDSAMPYAARRFAGLRSPTELQADMQPTGERYTLAARISGPAKSAFTQGLEGQLPGLKQAKQIQVLVVADTDMLRDTMWVQVQDFFGQRLPQPWAGNASFVVNAIDNLLGSDALLGVRSRAQFSRPFTLVDRLRRSAEERYAEKEQQLQRRLMQAEQKIAELQTGDTELNVSMQQQATIQQFMQERLQIRKELREVRYQLNADIESLGTTVKVFNVAVMPFILTFAMVLIGLHRRIRRMHTEA